MNTINNINNNLDNALIAMTVRCMLCPDNGFFYLPNMKLLDIEKLFNNMPEETRNSAVNGFFTAYHIARNVWEEKQQQINEILDAVDEEFAKHRSDICPECGCPNYVPGVKCPNCDYVD